MIDLEAPQTLNAANIASDPNLLAAVFALLDDATIRSEWQRRLGRRRKTHGLVWKNHNPMVKNCRCVTCRADRASLASK